MSPTDPVTLITGANSGIGRSTALELARRGHRVVLACRSAQRAAAVAAEVRAASPLRFAEVLELDLASLDSVRRCATAFEALGLPLHRLINNAGLAGHRGATVDGFELAFGINHLGHFLLTKLLLPHLRRGAGRVVNVSSGSHFDSPPIDWAALQRPTRTLMGLREYAVSKLCNALHAAELARREGATISTCSLHPGVVDSEAFRRVPRLIRAIYRLRMISPEEGARTSVYCATEPDLPTGQYWDECRPRPPSALALDPALATELWERSETWVSAR